MHNIASCTVLYYAQYCTNHSIIQCTVLYYTVLYHAQLCIMHNILSSNIIVLCIILYQAQYITLPSKVPDVPVSPKWPPVHSTQSACEHQRKRRHSEQCAMAIHVENVITVTNCLHLTDIWTPMLKHCWKVKTRKCLWTSSVLPESWG